MIAAPAPDTRRWSPPESAAQHQVAGVRHQVDQQQGAEPPPLALELGRRRGVGQPAHPADLEGARGGDDAEVHHAPAEVLQAEGPPPRVRLEGQDATADDARGGPARRRAGQRPLPLLRVHVAGCALTMVSLTLVLRRSGGRLATSDEQVGQLVAGVHRRQPAPQRLAASQLGRAPPVDVPPDQSGQQCVPRQGGKDETGLEGSARYVSSIARPGRSRPGPGPLWLLGYEPARNAAT